MKFLCALMLTVLALNASAATDRAIYDLMYLPKAGTNFGFSDVFLAKGSLEHSVSGVDINGDYTGWGVEQTIGRSFTDSLLINAQFGFSHIDNKVDYKGSGVSGEDNTTTKGFNDPVLNARFRLLDEGMQLDLLGSALISVGNSKSDGSQSNNLSGGHELTIGAQAGFKTESLQLAGMFLFTRHLKSTEEDEQLDEDTEADAYNDYQFQMNMLNKLAEQIFIKTTLGAEFIDKFENDENTDTASQTVYHLGAEFQYMVSSDLLLRTGLALSDYHQNGLDSLRIWTFNLGATYQF